MSSNKIEDVRQDRSLIRDRDVELGVERERLAKAELAEVDELQEFEAQHAGPLWQKVAFILMGTAELFVWNALLTLLYKLREEIFPDYPSMTDSLNAVEIIGELIAGAHTVYLGAMDRRFILGAGLTLSLATLAYACTAQWARGLKGVIIFHCIAFVDGFSCSHLEGGIFGLASALPLPMTAYAGIGQGVSGMATWSLWMIVSHCPLTTEQSLWVLMSCGCGLLLFCTATFWYFTQQPDIVSRLDHIKKALKVESENPNAPSYLFLFKACWRHFTTVGLLFASTLFIYPDIGPMGWDDGSFTEWINGAYFVTEFIAMVLTTNLPGFFVLAPSPLFVCAVVRALLIIPFGVVPYFLTDNSFWGNNPLHFIYMVLFSFSHGWMLASTYINTPKILRSEEWRSRVQAMVMVGIITGCFIGLWSARIFTAVTN